MQPNLCMHPFLSIWFRPSMSRSGVVRSEGLIEGWAEGKGGGDVGSE